MIRFILLSLLICLAIDDCYFLSSSIDFRRHQEKPGNLQKALENILKVEAKPMVEGINNRSLQNGFVFQVKEKMLIFIKMNCEFGSDRKFIGEIKGLKTIFDTETVQVPYPVATGYTDNYVHFFIVMEYLNMTSLDAQGSAELGNRLADLHLHNLQNKDKNTTIDHFGFDLDTRCGKIFQNNKWTYDWITFFIENRMEYQVQLLETTKKGSLVTKVVKDYWPRLKPKIPKFFKGINVKPSLLHGDLLPDNAAQVNSTTPVIFDPASFYGHHEYDIAVTTLFDGFKQEFFDAYFKKIPKAKGFENRMKLYHLFQHLYSWNQFGNYYKNSTRNSFKEVLNLYE